MINGDTEVTDEDKRRVATTTTYSENDQSAIRGVKVAALEGTKFGKNFENGSVPKRQRETQILSLH